MPKNSYISGEQWAKCDRCGFDHSIGMLSRQLGLTLCSDHGCLDDLITMRRPQMIQSILADGTEFQSQLVEIVADPGEVAFDD